MRSYTSPPRPPVTHRHRGGTQQKKQAYESLKAEFRARIKQAIRQQTGVDANVNIDVEKQPQFLDEWQRVQAQLEAQYLKLLGEYKQELAAID